MRWFLSTYMTTPIQTVGDINSQTYLMSQIPNFFVHLHPANTMLPHEIWMDDLPSTTNNEIPSTDCSYGRRVGLEKKSSLSRLHVFFSFFIPSNSFQLLFMLDSSSAGRTLTPFSLWHAQRKDPGLDLDDLPQPENSCFIRGFNSLSAGLTLLFSLSS